MINFPLILLILAFILQASCFPPRSQDDDYRTGGYSIESMIIRPTRPRKSTPDPELLDTTKPTTTTTTTTTTTQSITDDGSVDIESLVSSHQYPFMVSIQDKYGKHHCGGALISEYHILTAAHCVFDFGKPATPVKNFRIGVGLHDLRTGSQINYMSIRKIAVHRNYKLEPTNVLNDIALITLTNEIPSQLGSKASPIKVATADSEHLEADSNVIAVGWGSTQDMNVGEAIKTSSVLEGENFTVLSSSECARRSYTQTFPDTQMCIDSSEKALCKGDGGGPLFRKLPSGEFQLKGLASYIIGKTCVRPRSASYFTRVSKYYNWIQKITSYALDD